MRRMVDENFAPFDFREGLLIRPTLMILGSQRHVFGLMTNEMVVDGSSRRLIADALSDLYASFSEGEELSAEEIPSFQFADFVRARRRLVRRRHYARQLMYWERKVRDIDPDCSLPELTGPTPRSEPS